MKPPLSLLLLILVLLSVFSSLQKVFGLSARAPEWQPPTHLHLPGYNMQLLSSRAGSLGRDFSTGTMRRFRFRSDGDKPAIVITMMPVNSNKRQLMQLERITRDLPAFALKKPRLLTHRPADRSLGEQDQLAMATVNAETRLQTCLMRSGLAGYSLTTLGDEISRDDLRKFDSNPQLKYGDYLSRLLGLQPSKHWECLIVQLDAAKGSAEQQVLLKAWSAVRAQLLSAKGF
jgi:hypothetical protein